MRVTPTLPPFVEIAAPAKRRHCCLLPLLRGLIDARLVNAENQRIEADL